jgi:hypothetical protein
VTKNCLPTISRVGFILKTTPIFDFFVEMQFLIFCKKKKIAFFVPVGDGFT